MAYTDVVPHLAGAADIGLPPGVAGWHVAGHLQAPADTPADKKEGLRLQADSLSQAKRQFE